MMIASTRSLEIGHVFQEQTTVLQAGINLHLGPADVQRMATSQRIRKQCSESAELKGFVD